MLRVIFCLFNSFLPCLALLSSSFIPAAAQSADRWELLGSSATARGAERTRIALPDNEKRTRGVRLRVTRGSLAVTRAILSYANGQRHIEDKPFTVSQQPSPDMDEREAGMGTVVLAAVDVEHAASAGDAGIEVWGRMSEESAGTRSAARIEPGVNYQEVEILFGTSRKREADYTKHGRALATFGASDSGRLTLGRALVTIPKEGRAPGEIPRPLADLLLFRFELRKEDPKRDFTIAAVDVLPSQVFTGKLSAMATAARTFKGQAFVFVHGYNTKFDDALFRAAQITHDIGFDGAPIVFSWQSRGGTLDYDHDRAAVGEAKTHLATLLHTVSAVTGVHRIHVIAHSLGSDVLVRALLELVPGGVGAHRLKLGEIVFAAPDVDRASFARDAPRIRGLASGGVTLYASSADKPLKFSSWKTGRPRAGDVPRGASPLVVPGIDTIDISQGSMEVFALHHTDFAERRHLLTDIHDLLRKSVRPPNVRARYLFVQVGKAPLVYWLYQRN